MSNQRTIVVVLRSGGDFQFRDVELISRHIHGKWRSEVKPRIVCLWDKCIVPYSIGNINFIPLINNAPGTWSRIQLYSPELEQYKPFLYVDLDTAVITSIEDIFDLVKDESKFITLEDFWQKGQLATGLVWFPANSSKTQNIWNVWNTKSVQGPRMDIFLRKNVKADLYWQSLTNGICDFKESSKRLLMTLPLQAIMVCFHGKPRIFNAVDIKWVSEYVEKSFVKNNKVTIIIPYNIDRGYLKDAIASVPEGTQLLLSKGDCYWGENFNKVLSQATGDYIKFLHEDDMLTPNCIEDSVRAMNELDIDFMHGDAYEMQQSTGIKKYWKPEITIPTLEQMLKKNYIHSSSLMYRKSVFDKIGGFDETLDVAEEYEFNLRCLKAGLRLGYVNAPLAIYRRHEKQKVRTTPVKVKDAEREMVRNKYAQ
jgi:hypothetical protein